MSDTLVGHGRYAAAVDVDVLEDEDRGHPAREGRRPAREVPLVRRFRRVALEEGTVRPLKNSLKRRCGSAACQSRTNAVTASRPAIASNSTRALNPSCPIAERRPR